MMPIHFRTMVDDTVHWPRQNYEKDHVANVRGILCGRGRKWHINDKGDKELHDLSECGWNEYTGDVICSNYDKSPMHGLNKIRLYLKLAIKSTCRCQPSITLSKHAEAESSRILQSKFQNHLLRQEGGYCPWRNVNCDEFCSTVYIIVGSNMDEFCEDLLLFSYTKKGSSLSNSHHHILECFYDGERYLKSNKMNVLSKRNGTFWLRACINEDTNSAAADDRYQYDRTASLKQLVNLSWSLFEMIHKDYELIWGDLRELLNLRMAKDELDRGGGLEDVMSEYEGELYLQHLYITFKNQMMVDTSSKEDVVVFSDYIGSRQQCLYRCFCFLVLFISLYDSIDLMNMKNVDWFQGTVMSFIASTFNHLFINASVCH